MGSHPAPDFAGLIARVARELAAAQLPFMLIGGQAVLLHGRPRLTEDIDITLGVDPSHLDALLAACGKLNLIPLPTQVDTFVRETFVLPVRDTATAVRVDFVFSTTPFERQAIDRAQLVTMEDVAVPFATAEDLIIHKLFAGRPRDWEDAIGVVQRQESRLDWTYIASWAREFAMVPGREGMVESAGRLRREGAGPSS